MCGVRPVKVLAVLAGAYFGSLLIAAVLLLTTVARMSGKGAGRTGNAMLMMLSADAVLFLMGTLGVFLGLKKAVDNPAIRILLTVAYGVAMAITGVLIALFSAVFFNR